MFIVSHRYYHSIMTIDIVPLPPDASKSCAYGVPYLTCCFVVLTCLRAEPYALNHGRCGHSFCAVCVLKWAFNAIHRGCAYWHEPLECPLCRAELPHATDRTSRTMCTFPFVPNRLSDATITSLLAVLKDAADFKDAVRANAAEEPSRGWHGVVDEKVAVWGEGKSARVEWERRARSVLSCMSLSMGRSLTFASIVHLRNQERQEGDDLARHQLDNPSGRRLHRVQGSS